VLLVSDGSGHTAVKPSTDEYDGKLLFFLRHGTRPPAGLAGTHEGPHVLRFCVTTRGYYSIIIRYTQMKEFFQVCWATS
jgi:hypothetical protein